MKPDAQWETFPEPKLLVTFPLGAGKTVYRMTRPEAVMLRDALELALDPELNDA